MAVVVVAVVAVVTIGAVFFARKAFVQGSVTCVVTEEALADPMNVYDGSDHPLNPEVGDRYTPTSGCYVQETQCDTRVQLFGTRLECSP